MPDELQLTLHIPKQGMGKCRITYSVNATGSDSLYSLETVVCVATGDKLDPDRVEWLNPGLDSKIAKAAHGEYARTELGVDLDKPCRKKKKPKSSQPDQPTLF